MGQRVSPIAFRLGFSRVWESLYTETLYFKNYNYFVKSQILCIYVQGFFNKWMWNGRRSYFVNFVFSHLEVNWSYNFLNLYIYVYNTSLEYLKYSMFRTIFFNKRNLNFNKASSLFLPISERTSYQNRIYDFYLSIINFKNLYKLVYSLKKKGRKKRKLLKIVDFYIKKKKINYSRFKFFLKKISVYKQFFFSRKGIIGKYGINLKKLRKNKYSTKVILIYIFLISLLSSKFYNTFLIFFNFFFIIKPLEDLLKRFICKDFYYLLGFYKFQTIKNNFNLSVIRLNNYSITTSVFVRHIWLKLYKKYNFMKIIFNLLRSFKQLNNFKGLLINCNGRFTKKQRAWHSVFRYGNMPFSKQDALIDDSVIHVKLKYGISTIRLNFNYN